MLVTVLSLCLVFPTGLIAMNPFSVLNQSLTSLTITDSTPFVFSMAFNSKDFRYVLISGLLTIESRGRNSSSVSRLFKIQDF